VRYLQRPIWAVGVLVWLGAATVGISLLWAWDNEAGQAAAAQPQWPAAARLARAEDRPTLVLLAHPHCTCTRASLAELGEILGRARTRPKTFVVFLKPRGFADGWEQTDLWARASRLPDTTVVRDDDGAIAEMFGAMTSGQTFVYDARGRLQFSGGITGARAHEGDNAGRAAVLRTLGTPGTPGTLGTLGALVFGCPLFRAVHEG
jgi:hypothetical protein